MKTKKLFRGTKKPGTAVLSLGGGQNTKTVPGWWTKNFFEKNIKKCVFVLDNLDGVCYCIGVPGIPQQIGADDSKTE